MKKRTDEEKKQMIDNACDLMNEAAKKLIEARKLLHLCGIEVCDTFEAEKINTWDVSGSNLQIFSGIKKMGKLLGKEPYHKNDYFDNKPDTSRAFIDHKGLVFIQLGKEVTSKRAKFTYR